MSHIMRTIYAASGPGVQDDASPAGLLAMAYQHVHIARVTGLPVSYDTLTGPQEVEPGVRVVWATNPSTLDKQPATVTFDADTFDEDSARAWLGSHGVREYLFEADSQDKTAVQTGSREEPERPPAEGYVDLADFYANTIAE
jgi:hypothetical protein